MFSARVVALKDLFSDSYLFRLPYFQRAYAWRSNDVRRLLANVVEAVEKDGGKPEYVLGKVVLAQKPGEVEALIVDGHQRIMTLTILFAVLRDLETELATRRRLLGLIGGRDGLRLTPQSQVAGFVHRYVQAPEATARACESDLAELSETERNVIENRDALRTELAERDMDAELRQKIAHYLADRCVVIVATVADEDEGWSMLETEEQTRLVFNPAARAKASLLSIAPEADRLDCQRAWEKCESLLSSADLHALIGHIRTLRLRKRSDKPAEIFVAETMRLNARGAGAAFLENELLPAATMLAAIRKGEIGEVRRAEIAAAIDRTSWINSQFWVPAALLWLKRERNEDETLLFFTRIERLVWLTRIGAEDDPKKERRILQLLGEIDRGTPVAAMQEFELTRALRKAVLEPLRGPTFDTRKYAKQVLRRVALALGDDPGEVDDVHVTIEHILPKGRNTRWGKHFSDPGSVRAYCHRLGNLTFLTSAENRAADTLGWDDKRLIYAQSRYPITQLLVPIEAWTPAAIEARTEGMIRTLFAAWDLAV